MSIHNCFCQNHLTCRFHFIEKRNMAKTQDYMCPRCGYTSHRKSSMYNHFYKKIKPCPATRQVMELTNEVKEYILENKLYWELVTSKVATHSKIPISKALKIVCWNKYIGEDIGKAKCVCCNLHTITQHHFHCGHVLAESQGGKVSLENLRPICAVCNHSMGTMNMRQFAKTQFDVDLQ